MEVVKCINFVFRNSIIKNEGEYDNGIRIGEWIISYYGSNSVSGGGKYNNKGYKIDNWTEIVPHIGYCNLMYYI